MNGNLIKGSMEIIIPPNVMNADILKLKAVFISFESRGGGTSIFNAVSAFKKKVKPNLFHLIEWRIANVDTNTLTLEGTDLI